jgi:hypothetical protein
LFDAKRDPGFGVIAHISGVPAEELVAALTGAGAGLLVARGWIIMRVRRRRKAR